MTININDVNEGPTDINLSNNSIDENVAANTVVGTFSTTDLDTGDSFTYQLVPGTGDTDNAAFTIVEDKLQINSSPDFEAQSSYSILVQTTDPEGESYSENLTININDVNEVPTDLDLSNNSIDENVAANTVVGTFSTTDPDTEDTFTYQLVAGAGDTDNAAFTIDGDQLQINSSPDFEAQSSYSILVQSTDAEGLSYSENLTININEVWQPSVAFQIGGSGWREEGNDIAIDRNGDVWVTGDFRESIDIDGDGEDDLISNGYLDSYVAKFSSNGDLVRAYDFGSSSNYDSGSGIATDSNGNAWVLGVFSGSIDIDGDGINDLTSSKGANYLAKFDSEGDLVKALEINGTHLPSGKSIATDSKGNVWTKGRFSGNLDLDLDGINDLTSNGEGDSYVAKFSSEGDLVNAFQIGGSGDEHGHGIAIDSNDNVWTTGSFSGNIDIDGDGEDDLTNNGQTDGYVAKFSEEGDLVNASQIGGKDHDLGLDIATDSNGNAWVLGVFQGNIDIDGDGRDDLTNGSYDDFFPTDSYLAKFSSNGDFVKVLNIGGNDSRIATDSNDNLWVTGWFEDSIDIDGDGNNDLTSNGSHDSYVAKFSSNGDLVQALKIGGSDSDGGRAIATDSNGNVWTTGRFEGSIDIDGDGNNDLTSNGHDDIYVIKVAEEDITVTSAPEEVIQLKITPSEPTKAVEPNTSVSFDVNYSTEPAETPTTGIAFHMHWDSSQVAFDPVTGLTEHFSLGAQPISAVLDDSVTNGGLDGDPNTDKYILQAWIDAEGNWPNNSNLTLYTANFTALPGFEGTQINFSANPDHLPANSNFVPSSIALTSPTLDLDGNGVIDALTDSLVAIRYLFGFRGETLTKDVLGEGATRDTSEIVAYLDEVGDMMLDVDGNGTAGALTDGILLLRYALGFKDQALIEGAISEDATRTTAEAINDHLQSFDLM